MVVLGNVDTVADQLEQVPKRFLIVHPLVEVGSEFEVHLSKVHTHGLVGKVLEEGLYEIEAKSILLSSACGLEALGIDTIDVERDPVVLVPTFEVSVKLALNLFDVLCLAVVGLEDEHLLIFDQLVLLGLEGSDAEVADVRGHVHAFPFSVLGDHA